MTAKELIAKLQELPEDINIVMSGYEGGYNDIKGNFEEVEVALNYNTEWYYGSHEQINDWNKDMYEGKYKIEKVLVFN